LAVCAAVVLKAVGARLPLQACRPAPHSKWHRQFRKLAWVEGAALMTYGFALTSVGLLVQAGVVHSGRMADRRALAWHAYLWDPWFLLWGLLVVIALALNPTDRGNVRRRNGTWILGVDQVQVLSAVRDLTPEQDLAPAAHAVQRNELRAGLEETRT
jgi:hypothetical protein